MSYGGGIKQILGLLAFAVALALAGPASAQVGNHCYLVADDGGSSGGDDLLTLVDITDTSAATNEVDIGSGTGTNNIEAAALHPVTGVMYAADRDELGTIDLVSGVYSPIGDFGDGDGADGNQDFTDVDGLAFDPADNTLYGSVRKGSEDLLIQIDVATGAAVEDAFGSGVDYVVIPEVNGLDDVDAQAVDPDPGTMYATMTDGPTRLVTIDKTTGASANVGAIGVSDIEGLDMDPSGQLWGTKGARRLVQIDKATGAGVVFSTINNGDDYESITCTVQGIDTDGDTLSDFDEVVIYFTNPLNSDTDGGGAKDFEEVDAGTDPLSNPLDD